MAETGADPAVTHDTFFGGRLKLAQSVSGHRSGTDAVLLAAAVPRDIEGLVYDAGAGAGVVGLGIARLCPAPRIRLIERDPMTGRLAADNISTNSLEARVEIVTCDLLSKDARRTCLPDPAALVVTNPPFYEAARVRPSPDEARRAAHVFAPGVGLSDWVVACLDLLAVNGSLIVLHTAAALPALLQAVSGRAGGVTAMMVHSRAGAPAHRCLVRAKKGSRAPFVVAAPFILHEGSGFTAESDAVHRGDVSLRW